MLLIETFPLNFDPKLGLADLVIMTMVNHTCSSMVGKVSDLDSLYNAIYVVHLDVLSLRPQTNTMSVSARESILSIHKPQQR